MKRGLSLLIALTMLLGIFSAFNESILAKGEIPQTHNHQWIEARKISPTCMETGIVYEYCAICQESRTRELPFLGHYFPNPWTTIKEPRCTEPGSEMNKCVRMGRQAPCGFEWYREIPSLGHDFGEWYLLKEPQGSEPGIQERKCSRCDAKEQRNIIGPLPPKPKNQLSVTLKASVIDEQPLYHYNDTINYSCVITNTSLVPIYINRFCFVEPDGQEGYYVAGYFPNALEPGKSITFNQHRHDVTMADIDDFSPDYTQQFYVLFDIEQSKEETGQVSGYASVTVQIGDEVEEEGDVTIKKEIISTPSSKDGYMPGETVRYRLTVENHTGEEVYNVIVHDTNVPDSMVNPASGGIASLPIGGSSIIEYDYTVNKTDLAKGKIINSAQVVWTYDVGHTYDTWSNTVEAPVGAQPLQKIGVKLTKSVLGAPSNGEYYTSGEKITYSLVLRNATNSYIKDVKIVDTINGAAEATVDTASAVAPSLGVAVTFDYYVIDEDVKAGGISNQAFVQYRLGDSNEVKTLYSNTVTVKTGGSVTQPKPDVRLTKSVTYPPMYGSYYIEGEDIHYEIVFENRGDTDIYGVFIDDYKFDEHGYFDTVKAHSSAEMDFTHTVTKEEAENGSIFNQAQAEYKAAEDGEYLKLSSNEVTVATGLAGENEKPITMSLSKTEVSKPANGSFYTPGESVAYLITFINTSDFPMTIVHSEDTLSYGNYYESSNPTSGSISVAPGETLPIGYSHKVTSEEAEHGTLDNDVWMEVEVYISEDRIESYYPEDGVSVQTGFGVAEETRQYPVVYKTITNSPKNGEYYTEGEEIRYEIIVYNYTDRSFGDVKGYDVILNTPNHYYGGFGNLTDEPIKMQINHKVTKSDVVFGKVYNVAWFTMYDDKYNEPITLYSGEVTAITGGKTAEDKPPKAFAGGRTHCEYTLTAEGIGAWAYMNRYCGEHAAVESRVSKLLEGAETEAELNQATALAEQLWKRSLSSEYERSIAGATGELKEALTLDQIIFESYLSEYRARLELEGKNQYEINKTMIEALRDRACELCYTLGTAPVTRKDLYGAAQNTLERTDETECVITYTYETAFFAKDVIVCDRHLPLALAENRALTYAADDKELLPIAWQQIEQYWTDELNGSYERLEGVGDGLYRHTLLSEKTAFEACVRLRGELYKAYYRSDEAVSAELRSRMLREKAMSLCR